MRKNGQPDLLQATRHSTISEDGDKKEKKRASGRNGKERKHDVALVTCDVKRTEEEEENEVD